MEIFTIALFGEAEKGDFHVPYYCKSLPQLVDYLGNAPAETLGLQFAIQALLYNENLIFFRVKEEGFSAQDYYSGLRILQNDQKFSKVRAIALPGVGDKEIIEAVTPLCVIQKRIMILNEPDLFDFLRDR